MCIGLGALLIKLVHGKKKKSKVLFLYLIILPSILAIFANRGVDA